jgi:hypothetical protein
MLKHGTGGGVLVPLIKKISWRSRVVTVPEGGCRKKVTRMRSIRSYLTIGSQTCHVGITHELQRFERMNLKDWRGGDRGLFQDTIQIFARSD